MNSTSTPRRLHLHHLTGEAMNNLPPMPHCQTSPVSMRYSVQKSSAFGHETTISPQQSTSTAETSTPSSTTEKYVVEWNIRLLQGMALCSALFSMVTLQFYFANSERNRGKFGNYRNYVDVIKDIINSFDIAIVVCSITTFFISSLQLLFVTKIVKTQASNTELSLQYIQQTSFLRIVTFSFWFVSILIFAIIILLNCAIDPIRSLASKCVSITLGASAILLCIWFSMRTLYFWGRLACGHVYKENHYNHLSTLV